MKNKLNFIVMVIILLLFTNCKSSNVEPAKEYNLKIKSTTPLKTLKITLLNSSLSIVRTDYFLNVDKEISYDFDRCYRYEIYATGNNFVITYTLSKKGDWVETYNYVSTNIKGVGHTIR